MNFNILSNFTFPSTAEVRSSRATEDTNGNCEYFETRQLDCEVLRQECRSTDTRSNLFANHDSHLSWWLFNLGLFWCEIKLSTVLCDSWWFIYLQCLKAEHVGRLLIYSKTLVSSTVLVNNNKYVHGFAVIPRELLSATGRGNNKVNEDNLSGITGNCTTSFLDIITN